VAGFAFWPDEVCEMIQLVALITFSFLSVILCWTPFNGVVRTKVVNEIPALLGQFPYQAALMHRPNQFTCGSTIVSEVKPKLLNSDFERLKC
jgi:hypothetical protein